MISGYAKKDAAAVPRAGFETYIKGFEDLIRSVNLNQQIRAN